MIYLDNAATSFPKPRSVYVAMEKAIKTCGNAGRSGHIYALKSAEVIFECRKRMAKMFNTRPELVIFTSGATQSLNVAIKGTNRIGGVTVVSSLEHNAVMRPLNALRKNGDTVLRQFAVDIDSDLVTCENFSAVSRSATSVVITHASNVCGRILPVSQLRSLAHNEVIFILDASQTAGHIPIDIVELGVDIICVPAHKGLGGPMGLGAIIINPSSDVIIESIIEGGTGTNSTSFEMPEFFPEKLEAGTLNVYGIAGLNAALKDFSFSKKEYELFEYLVSAMKNMVDIILYGAPNSKNLSDFVPVVLFNKKEIDCETVADALAARGIAVRAGYHCAPNAHKSIGSYESGGVRVSVGRHNTHREIDRFLEALSDIKHS